MARGGRDVFLSGLATAPANNHSLCSCKYPSSELLVHTHTEKPREVRGGGGDQWSVGTRKGSGVNIKKI